jgi:hypothetical protein
MKEKRMIVSSFSFHASSPPLPIFSSIWLEQKFHDRPPINMDIAEFRTEIISKRQAGEVIFEIQEMEFCHSNKTPTSRREIIDLLMRNLNCSTLGKQWIEINREEAKKILLLILTKDLAYKTNLMSLSEAKQLLLRFFSFFTADCKFFTNASFTNDYSRIKSWNSITKATFDTGVVIVNTHRIGILWVEDED